MTLAIGVTAQMARMTRAAVVDQLNQPYVEMAMLKGIPPGRIVLTHVLPNAIGPIVNATALSLSSLLGALFFLGYFFFQVPGVIMRYSAIPEGEEKP